MNKYAISTNETKPNIEPKQGNNNGISLEEPDWEQVHRSAHWVGDVSLIGLTMEKLNRKKKQILTEIHPDTKGMTFKIPFDLLSSFIFYSKEEKL